MLHCSILFGAIWMLLCEFTTDAFQLNFRGSIRALHEHKVEGIFRESDENRTLQNATLNFYYRDFLTCEVSIDDYIDAIFLPCHCFPVPGDYNATLEQQNGSRAIQKLISVSEGSKLHLSIPPTVETLPSNVTAILYSEKPFEFAHCSVLMRGRLSIYHEYRRSKERKWPFEIQVVLSIRMPGSREEFIPLSTSNQMTVTWRGAKLNSTDYTLAMRTDGVQPDCSGQMVVGIAKKVCKDTNNYEWQHAGDAAKLDSLRLYGIVRRPGASVKYPLKLTYLTERRLPLQKSSVTAGFPCSLFDTIYIGFCFKLATVYPDGYVRVHRSQCVPADRTIGVLDRSACYHEHHRVTRCYFHATENQRRPIESQRELCCAFSAHPSLCASFWKHSRKQPGSVSIDGEWSQWSPWGGCGVVPKHTLLKRSVQPLAPCQNSRTDSGGDTEVSLKGVQYRTRSCTEPEAKGDGAECLGAAVQARQCSVRQDRNKVTHHRDGDLCDSGYMASRCSCGCTLSAPGIIFITKRLCPAVNGTWLVSMPPAAKSSDSVLQLQAIDWARGTEKYHCHVLRVRAGTMPTDPLLFDSAAPYEDRRRARWHFTGSGTASRKMKHVNVLSEMEITNWVFEDDSVWDESADFYDKFTSNQWPIIAPDGSLRIEWSRLDNCDIDGENDTEYNNLSRPDDVGYLVLSFDAVSKNSLPKELYGRFKYEILSNKYGKTGNNMRQKQSITSQLVLPPGFKGKILLIPAIAVGLACFILPITVAILWSDARRRMRCNFARLPSSHSLTISDHVGGRVPGAGTVNPAHRRSSGLNQNGARNNECCEVTVRLVDEQDDDECDDRHRNRHSYTKSSRASSHKLSTKNRPQHEPMLGKIGEDAPLCMRTSALTECTRLSGVSANGSTSPGMQPCTSRTPAEAPASKPTQRSVGIQLSGWPSPSPSQSTRLSRRVSHSGSSSLHNSNASNSARQGTHGRPANTAPLALLEDSESMLSIANTDCCQDMEYDYFDLSMPTSYLGVPQTTPGGHIPDSLIDIDDIIGDSELMRQPANAVDQGTQVCSVSVETDINGLASMHQLASNASANSRQQMPETSSSASLSRKNYVKVVDPITTDVDTR